MALKSLRSYLEKRIDHYESIVRGNPYDTSFITKLETYREILDIINKDK